MCWSAPLSADVKIDPRTAPEACASMAEVRHGVDALDRALVRLLAERQRYMDAAARIKPDRSVVHDNARIEDVVQKVLAAAGPAGLSPAIAIEQKAASHNPRHHLSPDIAEPVWRTLIDRCIAHEFEAWDRTRR